MAAKDLKNALLQEAVQGRLVPQIATEGNARDLLEEIKKSHTDLQISTKSAGAKSDLRSKSQIRVTKKELPPVIDEEVPFDIPESWCWCRLGEIINYKMGKTPPRAESEWWGNKNDIPWISIADMIADGHIFSTKETMSKKALKEIFNNNISPKGTLIMSFKLTVGRVSILDIDATHNEAIISIFPYVSDSNIMRDYLFNVLPLLSQNGDTKDAIKGKTLNSTSLSNLLIPLPPLAEQKRIVAAIEKFMPLIKEYGKKESALNLLNAQIGTLTRKAILQEAVQGKLVPQIASEGNARDLLEEIKKSHTDLQISTKSADKKSRDLRSKSQIRVIKKELPPVTDEEVPFDIPESWCWVYFGDIFQHNTGKTQNSSVETKNGTIRKFITTSNLYWNEFDFTKVKEMLFSDSELERCTATKGDLLICEGGEYGRSAIWNYDYNVCFQNHIHRARPYLKDSLDIRFYYYVIYLFRNIGLIEGRGVGIKSLSTEILHQVKIPLPPLAEQKRIVGAIEKLLPLCKKLGQ